ncbi:MAG: hypothetical protein ACFFER_04170 [Candidatus Thorarchaeota archaeon]
MIKLAFWQKLPSPESAILKENVISNERDDGEMSAGPVEYKSDWGFIIAFIVGIVLNLVVGVILSSVYLPLPFDLVPVLALFLGYPTLSAIFAYFIGWYSKKHIAEYTPPEWEFQPVQLKLEEVPEMVKEYHHDYSRLEARSNYWTYHLPLIVIMLIFSLPFYLSFMDSSVLLLAQFIIPAGLILNHAVASIGAFFATSNEASEDFALPLVREALWLGNVQSKVPGISQIRLVLDKAVHDGFRIYREPRIVMRISGVEHDAYIESWSEDLRAITRVLCRLYESEEHGQVVWWWISTDRNFRKYTDVDNTGYYVRLPVPSPVKELGVRDVRLVTENAVAILLLEISRLQGESGEIASLLAGLGVG